MAQTYAILGAGRSGAAAISYLTSHGVTELTVYVRPEELAAVRARYPDLRVTDDWSRIGADVLLRSPGLRPDIPPIAEAVARGARLSSEIELFCERCRAPIYAVTGSDGKTTTATLAACLLREAGYRVHLGGNIGRALLPEADGILPDDRVVLELSSFQLMTFSPALAAAAVTNLTENHLNWHRDMEEYRLAKRRILLRAPRRVQNALCPVAPELSSLSFSARCETANYREAHGVLWHGEEPLCRVEDIRLPGLYNRENLLCAAALVGAGAREVRAVAKTFDGVAHRMEYIGTYRGVRCYDSSIDTTPARTAATLTAVTPPCTVICGGSDKNLSCAPLSEALIARAARVVFTGACGENMRDHLLACPRYTGVPQCCYIGEFAAAVAAALDDTPAGGTLLLSPAAASFDAFSSYVARGEAFRRILESL